MARVAAGCAPTTNARPVFESPHNGGTETLGRGFCKGWGCPGDSGTERPPMPMPSAFTPSHAVGRFGTGTISADCARASFDGDGLCEVARLVDIGAALQCHVIGEQLQR